MNKCSVLLIYMASNSSKKSYFSYIKILNHMQYMCLILPTYSIKENTYILIYLHTHKKNSFVCSYNHNFSFFSIAELLLVYKVICQYVLLSVSMNYKSGFSFFHKNVCLKQHKKPFSFVVKCIFYFLLDFSFYFIFTLMF